MEFIKFKAQVRENFEKITENATHVYEAAIDKDVLWNLYLDSFPAGTNEIFRERREYDCSCCRQFMRAIGGVVIIENNEVKSIWDFETGNSTFQPVVDALSTYVKSKAIENIYLSNLKIIGTDKNFENAPDKIYEWNHLYLVLPGKFVYKGNKSIESMQGNYRDVRNVFKRSLDEISVDSVNIILELIAQNSLYKGEEWETVLIAFLKYKKAYDKLSSDKKELYAWEKSTNAGTAVGKIRNHSIGTLLINISEGLDLDTAVKKYEAMVAPSHYKRPKAIFTAKMLEDAKKKLIELGYMDSLRRRFATLDDITINNILFSNKDAAKRMGAADIFEEMGKSIAVDAKKFNKVEEISIEDFIRNVLPTARDLEILLENKHAKNMVSLIAPEVEDAKTMFKWDNNYSWAYSGNITDSEMKENVKNAGGSVDGDLRFSIQWNDEIAETCDLDAHCVEPKGYEIYYSNKGRLSPTQGVLDTDIVNPKKDIAAVENITWASRHTMVDGEYLFFVRLFSGRLKGTVRAEIEFDGEIHTFEANSNMLNNSNNINIAKVILENGEFSIMPLMNSSSSIHSKEVWGVDTNQFIPVSVMMHSPNYWNEQEGIGHKHYFFMLKDCVNPENPNGFYNEFLKNELLEHKRVFEALGRKMSVQDVADQLSGIGFSSTKRNDLIVKVKGATERMLKVKF